MYDVKKFGPNGDVVHATNTQPGMHTPATHAVQQTQAQQPWIILKSLTGVVMVVQLQKA
jgi:hypothetical protein